MNKAIVKEYFVCSACKGNRFTKHYEFSMSFRDVNFSDDLVYDKQQDEFYVCTNCEQAITASDIRTGLREIKQKQKAIDKENRDGI